MSKCTHICYTKELFPIYLCNHFGPHSMSGDRDASHVSLSSQQFRPIVASQIVPNIAAKERVNEIVVFCPNRSSGCIWTGQLATREEHRNCCLGEHLQQCRDQLALCRQENVLQALFSYRCQSGPCGQKPLPPEKKSCKCSLSFGSRE